MRDDRERLRDVLEAIERIEKYAGRGREALASEELLQSWVVHHLMIVGEACRALSADPQLLLLKILNFSFSLRRKIARARSSSWRIEIGEFVRVLGINMGLV